MPATQIKNKNERKLKIQSKKKSYTLQDSSLYQLSSKVKLCDQMFSTLEMLKLLVSDSNYKVFPIKKPNGESRWIETPNDSLNLIHTRIASLLVRIKQPDYVHSGVKGRSNITNAKSHVGNHPVLTMDLKSFYPSVTKKSIYNFFKCTLKAAPDVAGMLAELCTYKDHIPTGSRISMPLAYWANHKMYSDINDLCESRGINMTIYVDDFTFSGAAVNNGFKKTVERIIKNAGMTVHPDKTKLYKADKAKLITGVVVEGMKMKVRNKHHKAIHNLFSEKHLAEQDDIKRSIDKRLIGHLTAAGQVDSKFKQKAANFRSEHI